MKRERENAQAQFPAFSSQTRSKIVEPLPRFVDVALLLVAFRWSLVVADHQSTDNNVFFALLFLELGYPPHHGQWVVSINPHSLTIS